MYPKNVYRCVCISQKNEKKTSRQNCMQNADTEIDGNERWKILHYAEMDLHLKQTYT